MIQWSMPVFILVALLCMAMALPLMRRRVGPNGVFGLRVSATLADEWVWYEANARSGRDLLILGTLELLVAILPAVAFPLPDGAYLLLNFLVLTIGALAVAVVGAIRARQLLDERRRDADST